MLMQADNEVICLAPVKCKNQTFCLKSKASNCVFIHISILLLSCFFLGGVTNILDICFCISLSANATSGNLIFSADQDVYMSCTQIGH